MTNSDLTLIGVLVDRSGSMSSCREDMEGGLNTFVKNQAKLPGDAELTLAQFDTVYEIIHSPKPINDVPYFVLSPRGCTALLDAMGRFITEVGEHLAARAEQDRPGKVIMCIVTDGYENSSKDWTRADVRKLVEQQQNDYQWEFVFLGANIDAVREAASFGIARCSSLTFNTAKAGQTYAVMDSYVADSRSGLSASFSEEDRKRAMEK